MFYINLFYWYNHKKFIWNSHRRKEGNTPKCKEKRHKKDESEKSKNFSKANSHKHEGKWSSGNLQPSINLLPKYKFQIKKTKSNYYLIKKTIFVYQFKQKRKSKYHSQH